MTGLAFVPLRVSRDPGDNRLTACHHPLSPNPLCGFQLQGGAGWDSLTECRPIHSQRHKDCAFDWEKTLFDFRINRVQPGQVDRFSLILSRLILRGFRDQPPKQSKVSPTTSRLGLEPPGGIGRISPSRPSGPRWIRTFGWLGGRKASTSLPTLFPP